MRNTHHCCSEMIKNLMNNRVPIQFCSVFKEYYIPFRTTPNVGQLIFYCPWCGISLPKTLRAEYFDILEKEYGMEPTFDIYTNLALPEDFRSDAWWQKDPGVPYIFKERVKQVGHYIAWNYIGHYFDGYDPKGRHIGGIDPELNDVCAPPIFGQHMFPHI